jgi:hypothetical protein
VVSLEQWCELSELQPRGNTYLVHNVSRQGGGGRHPCQACRASMSMVAIAVTGRRTFALCPVSIHIPPSTRGPLRWTLDVVFCTMNDVSILMDADEAICKSAAGMARMTGLRGGQGGFAGGVARPKA